MAGVLDAALIALLSFILFADARDDGRVLSAAVWAFGSLWWVLIAVMRAQ